MRTCGSGVQSRSKWLLRCTAIAGLCFACVLTSPPTRAGDPTAGKDVYRSECAECHSIERGRNKKGPSLFGIVGRPAGTEPNYHYTDALRNAHWIWTTDKLHWYLSQPARQANPGTRMKYDGLTDPKDLDNLIAFLGTLH